MEKLRPAVEFAKGQGHMDDVSSAFIERALTYVARENYNTEFPPLKGRQFVPVDNSVPAGASAYNYKQYTRTGVAKLITARGQDLPLVSLYVREFSHKFYRAGAAYEYSRDDLLAAQMASQNGSAINIDMELATAAREAIEKKLDNIARVGSADGLSVDVGLLGLVNQTNATIYTVQNGAAASPLWANKTPDEILFDLSDIAGSQVAATYEVEEPDTILLPTARFELIAGKSMGDGRAETILSYFLKTNPHIKTVASWSFLATAGAGSTARMVCYKKDPRKVRHVISEEFTQGPTEYRNGAFLTPCTAKTAGVVCPYPLSISYGDGI